MDIRLRTLNPDQDYPRLADLLSTTEFEPVSPDMLLARQQSAPPAQVQHTTLAISTQNSVLGFSQILHNPWVHRGQFWISIVVDPAWRRRGIGSALYDHALAFLDTQEANLLITQVRDNSAPGLEFALHRGFTLTSYTLESWLYLSDFDDARFHDFPERLQASGIQFFTLADIEATNEHQRWLYDLHRRIYETGSNSAHKKRVSISSFHDFQRMLFLAPWFRPEGQFIAADGERWVGTATVGHYINCNSMHNTFTGVERAYRGRGIALALKLLAIRYARRRRADYILTRNDAENAAMLSINRKLGYQIKGGYFSLACRIEFAH
ncbi:N-acetyltransferase [Ktedonobacter sp. SOSP1-52]|uniref:GNAT family N-acetyltransferase n=1 Tax=Ktedonobacter sp. SOSP1-52 TaxID=2778366 RepID=UPI001915C41F|nr:GNAT family N-acetyltransferase [Ktedonobacter sp. SOSP1-52]GHO69608.1 N-acetyltransferase [Ktedonobacter sp. SOSP1-52]